MNDPEVAVAHAPWPPAFSDRFIAQTRELLHRRSALLIVGPQGGNAHRLAADVVGAPEGPVWSRHVCRYGDQDHALFAAGQVFRAIGDVEDADVDTAVRTARRELDGTPGPRPTVILADAQLCDAASIEVFARLTVEGAISIVATAAADTVPGDWPLLRLAERVDLPPLDLPRVTQLLRARFGRDPHAVVAELILERSSGVYEIVKDLADAAVAAGVIVPLEDTLVINPEGSRENSSAMADLMHDQWGADPTDDGPLRDLFDLTAVIGGLDLAEARDVLGAAAVAEGLAIGRLVSRGEVLAFASRAESMTVSRTTAPERLAALFDAYAERLTVSTGRVGVAVRVADWWRAVGRLLPPDLAARASREANLCGRYRRAVVFSDPASNRDGVLVAPTERLFAQLELGDRAGIGVTFRMTDPSTLEEDELLPYLRWADRLVQEPERTRLVEQALSGDHPAARRRRAAVRTLGQLLERIFDGGGDEIISRLRALTFTANLSPFNRSMAFTALSAAHRHAGQPAQAVDAAVHALELVRSQPGGPSAFHLALAQEFHFFALLAALDVDGAERALRDYSYGAFGLPGSGRMGHELSAMLEMFRGDSPQAVASARIALQALQRHDPRDIRGWIEGLLGQVLVQRDRRDEARVVLEASKAHPSRLRTNDLEARLLQACVHDALGEPEEALEVLEGVRDEARRHGLGLAQVDATVLMVQIGGPTYLPALLDSVDGLVEPSGSPAVWQSFARAVQRYDIPALVDIADELVERGAHLFAAEVAQFVLDMARRATDLDDEVRGRLDDIADPHLHRRPL